MNANLNDDHREVAKHITSHGSVYSRADISAILYMGVDLHEREMLLEDKSTVDLNLPINPDDGDENNGYGTNDDGIGITRTGGSGSTGGNTGDLGTSDIATLFDVSSCK